MGESSDHGSFGDDNRRHMDQNSVELILSGQPVAWAPSRVVHGKHAFNPKYREKEHHEWEIRKQYTDEPITYAVGVIISFYMSIPKSTSKRMREEMLKNEIFHTKKPDVDNLTKYAIDVVKGIVIRDDNQVVEIFARKLYSENPHADIHVFKMENYHATEKRCF